MCHLETHVTKRYIGNMAKVADQVGQVGAARELSSCIGHLTGPRSDKHCGACAKLVNSPETSYKRSNRETKTPTANRSSAIKF